MLPDDRTMEILGAVGLSILLFLKVEDKEEEPVFTAVLFLLLTSLCIVTWKFGIKYYFILGAVAIFLGAIYEYLIQPFLPANKPDPMGIKNALRKFGKKD